MARRLPPPFTSTLVGVSRDFGPSRLTTIGGGVATFTQVPLDEFFHMGVVLPLQSQLNEQVHEVIVRMCTPLPLKNRPAIFPRTKGNFTHKPQVGISGSIRTHIHPGEHKLQFAHIFRDSRSGRKFREHRKLLNLCAHTEIRLIDGECFFQSLENLSPG